MRRSSLLLLAALAPGCFYVEPINQRPSAQIKADPNSPALPQRKGAFTLDAAWSDPDGDDVTFSWSVSACTPKDGCGSTLLSGDQPTFPLDSALQNPALDGQVTALHVTLDVTDAHGALAMPRPDLMLPLDDRNPTLTLFAPDGFPWPDASTFPISLPIKLRAAATPDGGGAIQSFDWKLMPPPGRDPNAPNPLVQLSDPMANEETWQLTPDFAGDWKVQVTATDAQGKSSMDRFDLVVAADQPPCLGTTDPGLVAGTITLDQARRFSVLTVDDDIDVYPPRNDGIHGTATFTWYLASPSSGGALVKLGTDANDVVVDPTAYAPGDQLDVRVEIADRVARQLCDPSQPTCSITADTCLQRQTWHLEIP